MSIGANIREKRVLLGMTQVELAAMVGVKQSMIAQIERGTKTPSLPLGMQIAEALRCEIRELTES